MDEQMTGLVTGALMILMAVAVAVWAVGFVTQSAAVYTMAKRRGIRRPYLAWFPVLRQCILGAIADQYLYVTRGRSRCYRVILPVADFLWRLMASFMLRLAWDLLAEQASFDLFFGMLGLLSAVPMTYLVSRLLSRYWVLRSCAGKNGVLAYVLCVTVPLAEPALLLWYCRSDRGMPPRKQEESQK
ncbi:MAG: hypothetical protein E7459_10740 [Ruminococcaceae bacterium]|nr:hypothetical protein [Oscillospiraceae bacterium]